MEQKQQDEMENSFAGEEFLDETDLADDVIIEDVKPKKNRKPAKKVSPKEMRQEEDFAESFASKAEEKKVDWGEHWGEKKQPGKELGAEKQAEKHQDKGHDAPVLPPSDPWKTQETPSGGALGKVSTWKSITGIMIILLLLSLFTQGFSFAGKGETIPAPEAEAKVLGFVNSNLLRPPFTATVVASEETGNLYKVTLLVAGEQIDSYITKDGQLFFPQGFDPAKSLVEQLPAADTEAELEQQPAPDGGEEYIEEVVIDGRTGEQTVRLVPREEPVEDTAEEGIPEENSVEASPEAAPEPEIPASFTLTAKRWLFTPNRITVPVGKKVTFTIKPQDLDFTFSLPEFGIEKQVSGTTVVEFTPDRAGTFQFSCSSCEEWRGMSGTLVVE